MTNFHQFAHKHCSGNALIGQFWGKALWVCLKSKVFTFSILLPCIDDRGRLHLQFPKNSLIYLFLQPCGYIYDVITDYWWGCVLHQLRLLAWERKPMMHSSEDVSCQRWISVIWNTQWRKVKQTQPVQLCSDALIRGYMAEMNNLQLDSIAKEKEDARGYHKNMRIPFCHWVGWIFVISLLCHWYLESGQTGRASRLGWALSVWLSFQGTIA